VNFSHIPEFGILGCDIVRRRWSPTPIKRQRPAPQQRSKHRQALTQSEDTPDRWQCQIGSWVLPLSMGRRLVAVTVRAPTARVLAVISRTRHPGQWSRASFRISRNMIFVPTHEKIKRARWEVWHLVIYTVRKNWSGRSEPTPGILRSVLGASAFSSSKPHNAQLTVSGDWTRRATTSIHPTRRGSKEGEPSCSWFREECVAFVPRRSNPNKPVTQCNSAHGTQIYQGTLIPSILFTHFPLSLLKVCISAKSTVIQTGNPHLYCDARGIPGLG
jgi:hypothetical protein